MVEAERINSQGKWKEQGMTNIKNICIIENCKSSCDNLESVILVEAERINAQGKWKEQGMTYIKNIIFCLIKNYKSSCEVKKVLYWLRLKE